MEFWHEDNNHVFNLVTLRSPFYMHRFYCLLTSWCFVQAFVFVFLILLYLFSCAYMCSHFSSYFIIFMSDGSAISNSFTGQMISSFRYWSLLSIKTSYINLLLKLIWSTKAMCSYIVIFFLSWLVHCNYGSISTMEICIIVRYFLLRILVIFLKLP